MRSHLVPKQTVTKRGVLTTVHVNPDQEAGTSKSQQRASQATTKAPTSLAQSQPMLTIPGSDLTFPPMPTEGRARVVDGVWDGEKLQHSFIKRGDIELYAVAPPGYSGAHCYQCGSFYLEDEITPPKTVCTICGFTNYDQKMPHGIKAEDVELYDEEACRERVWYHITTREDWERDIFDAEDPGEMPFVHLGSREAALDRMSNLMRDEERQLSKGEMMGYHYSPPTFYLYAVRINDRAPIASAVVDDHDAGAPETINELLGKTEVVPGFETDYWDYLREYEPYGATRYVNSYESRGSVSLIANPNALDIVERTRLT